MKLLMVCLGLSALLAATLSARVGENEAELVLRYGEVRGRQPARTMSQGRTFSYGEYLRFHVDDWNIEALMIGKKCEEVSYTKLGDWTEEQINHILEINGGRSQWEEQTRPSSFSPRLWKRRDRTMATLRGGIGFEIKTPVVEETRTAIDKAAKVEASKLPKF